MLEEKHGFITLFLVNYYKELLSFCFFWMYFLFCYIVSVESFQINCVALVI